MVETCKRTRVNPWLQSEPDPCLEVSKSCSGWAKIIQKYLPVLILVPQVAKLTGHSYRVLYLAMSPDGEAIVTGAGDETLRFWNVFR